MTCLRITLSIMMLSLVTGCAQIDAYLFDAYPDGTPISGSERAAAERDPYDTPMVAESAETADLKREVATLRKSLEDQRKEISRLKNERPLVLDPEAAEQDEAIVVAEPQPVIQERLWIRITFQPGQTRLTKAARDALYNSAKKFLELPAGRSIEARSYCDDEPISRTKGRNSNLIALTQKRADAVSQELIKAGIPAERIKAEGFGATNFIAENTTEQGRNRNRRVDLYLIGG